MPAISVCAAFLPPVLRPDLLLTEDGFALTELDSVPGGIGLTAFLNRLYEGGGDASSAAATSWWRVLPVARAPASGEAQSADRAGGERGGRDLPPGNAVAGRRAAAAGAAGVLPAAGGRVSARRRPVLRRRGHAGEDRYHLPVLRAVRPRPTSARRRISSRPGPTARWSLRRPCAISRRRNSRSPSFTTIACRIIWAESLGRRTLKLLRQLIPMSWVMDPAPLPPGAVLDGPRVGRPGAGRLDSAGPRVAEGTRADHQDQRLP